MAMTKIKEVLETLSDLAPAMPLSEALRVAEKIEAIYTPLTPESWAKANVSKFYSEHKIQFIKDIRAAVPGTSLVDAKNAAEDAISDWSLARLREKLLSPHPVDDYNSATTAYLDEDGDMAFARDRERMAEQGTWFGAPGPLDEEPPF